MQQPGQMFPVMPAYSPPNITTEQIQKYLDENKKLILAILDNQNLGKLAECAQYQAQLQKNLMYLAAIADAQPQTPAIPSQISPHPTMQQGGFYMQHPQAAAMAQQSPGMFQQRPPFTSPHPLQDPQNSQQLHAQGPMTLRPIGTNNGMNPPNTDGNHGGGSSCTIPASNPGLTDARKQDKPDGQGNSAPASHGGEGEEAK